MSTFGSLNSTPVGNNSYSSDGSYTVVKYAQSFWNYKITIDPNDTSKITVVNSTSNQIDYLTKVNEIDFKNGNNYDVYYTPFQSIIAVNTTLNGNVYLSTGDQSLTIGSGSSVYQVLLGSGNDTVNNSIDNLFTVLAFPNAVSFNVDLSTGVAKDNLGHIDRFSNFSLIATGGGSKDIYTGTVANDTIMLLGYSNWKNYSGRLDVYGNGGNDLARIWDGSPSDYQISPSIDGKTVTIVKDKYTVVLHDISDLEFDNNNSKPKSIIHFSDHSSDLVDISKLGNIQLNPLNTPGWSASTTQAKNPIKLTYSFMSSLPSYGGAEGGLGFTSASDDYKSAVRSILSKLSTTIAVDFTEVSDTSSSYGQLRFGANQQSNTKGYSFNPAEVKDDRAGDVWLDNETLGLLKSGQEGWQVLLHEIGHALGLSHPLSQISISGVTVSLLPWDNPGFTVMSENTNISNLWDTWFQPLDIQTLQSMYGFRVNPSTLGDTTYKFTDSFGQSITSLDDGSGKNTIDLTSLTSGAYIDLNAKNLSSVGMTLLGIPAIDNLSFSTNSSFSNIIGSKFDDVLIGTAASEIFKPGLGNNTVDGGGGINQVIYDGNKSQYKIAYLGDSGHWNLQAKDSSLSDELKNVQRLKFIDSSLALDLMPSQSAGMAVELLNAALGPAGVNNQKYLGIGIHLFDAGMTMKDAAELVVGSAAMGSLDNSAFVKVVWNNVVGSPIDSSSLIQYVKYLENGTFTQGSLLATAAHSSFNDSKINLVGLQELGIEYFEVTS